MALDGEEPNSGLIRLKITELLHLCLVLYQDHSMDAIPPMEHEALIDHVLKGEWFNKIGGEYHSDDAPGVLATRLILGKV